MMSANSMGPDIVCRRVLISGRVQGVGFRASTEREAMRYPGLRGYVKNLPGGDVEVMLQGSVAVVDAMVQWCAQGPPQAQVEDLQVTELKADPGLSYFEIR